MGYHMQDGRYADTRDVVLAGAATRTESGSGAAIELGDRGTLRLQLAVTGATAQTTDEEQTVAVTDAEGGTFTLSLDGQTTSAIAHDADAATVQAALEALSTIGEGNVECSGGPLGTEPVTVTFIGSLSGTNVPEMVADDALLTGEGATVTVTTSQAGSTATPKLDVTVETSHDGTTWRELGAFTQATSAGSERKSFPGCDRFVRASYEIESGSFTFGLTGEAV